MDIDSKSFSIYLEFMEFELKMELCLVIHFAKNIWSNVHALMYLNTTLKVKTELESSYKFFKFEIQLQVRFGISIAKH